MKKTKFQITDDFDNTAKEEIETDIFVSHLNEGLL